MPLPPALAAKLAKRGIIKKAEATKDVRATEPNSEIEAKSDLQGPAEEIIAESYDDSAPNLPGGLRPEAMQGPPLPLDMAVSPYMGFSNCPNKWNVYHDCTHSCESLWGVLKPLDEESERRRLKMMSKYPLLPNWKEVLDRGIGRYYYWNTDTDMVSWLPPSHPKCRVSRSASDLRQLMHTERSKRLAQEAKAAAGNDSAASVRGAVKRRASSTGGSDHSSDSNSDSDDDAPPPPPSMPPPPPSSLPPSKKRRGERPSRGRAPPKDDLDPMDPASYGDCGRGNWSSGLPDRTEAKTGVDSTASGPLFQQRPYPSPGSVLRVNAASGVGPNKPS